MAEQRMTLAWLNIAQTRMRVEGGQSSVAARGWVSWHATENRFSLDANLEPVPQVILESLIDGHAVSVDQVAETYGCDLNDVRAVCKEKISAILPICDAMSSAFTIAVPANPRDYNAIYDMFLSAGLVMRRTSKNGGVAIDMQRQIQSFNYQHVSGNNAAYDTFSGLFQAAFVNNNRLAKEVCERGKNAGAQIVPINALARFGFRYASVGIMVSDVTAAGLDSIGVKALHQKTIYSQDVDAVRDYLDVKKISPVEINYVGGKMEASAYSQLNFSVIAPPDTARTNAERTFAQRLVARLALAQQARVV